MMRWIWKDVALLLLIPLALFQTLYIVGGFGPAPGTEAAVPDARASVSAKNASPYTDADIEREISQFVVDPCLDELADFMIETDNAGGRSWTKEQIIIAAKPTVMNQSAGLVSEVRKLVKGVNQFQERMAVYDVMKGHCSDNGRKLLAGYLGGG